MTRTLLVSALAALIVGSAATAHAQISVDVHVGPPPPPRAYHVPPRPGPDYEWIEGYNYPQGSHYKWHDGYWTRPPYAGAYWVAPYYSKGRYFAGRWDGPRGHVAHDHRWDRDAERDDRHDQHPQRDDRKY